MSLDVVWSGVEETAAIKAQQRHPTGEPPRRQPRGSSRTLCVRVLDVLSARYFLALGDIMTRSGLSRMTANEVVWKLCEHDLVERERPLQHGIVGRPQRYRLRSMA
jgi:response regulator of citrate/malate metabolism